jgi:hypothetical protein
MTNSNLSRATTFVDVGLKINDSSIFLRTLEKSFILMKKSNVKIEMENSKLFLCVSTTKRIGASAVISLKRWFV